MNRHLDEGQLHDFREGLLSGAEEARVSAHLEECPVCRETLGALVRLGAGLAGLNQDAEPPRDLWPQILWRIGERSPGGATEGHVPQAETGSPAYPRRFHLRAWQLIAAGLVISLLSGGSVWLLLSGRGQNPGTLVEAPVSTDAVPAGLEEAFGEYEATVSGLEELLAQGEGVLDPETVRVLEENLAIIDGAITEAREALSRDPGSNVLRRLLTENLRRKVELLRHAAVAVRAET
jgi:anti-sigma factor RsiW